MARLKWKRWVPHAGFSSSSTLLVHGCRRCTSSTVLVRLAERSRGKAERCDRRYVLNWSLSPAGSFTSDVIAVVHSVGELGSINTKQGKPFSKRELTLADRSGYSCRCTLWGKQAEQWNHNDNPVVAFKGLKLSDFNGQENRGRRVST